MKPPELTSEVRGSHRGIGLSFCLSDEVAVVQMPLHSPLLLMHLPLHPGFGGGCHGILASSPFRMNLKKKTCLSLYVHIFFSFTVAAGVLGSAGVWRWFQCAPSSRKFLCCKLVPKMAVLGDETSKGEGLARGLIIGVLPYNWINGSRVLKTPTQSCWE